VSLVAPTRLAPRARAPQLRTYALFGLFGGDKQQQADTKMGKSGSKMARKGWAPAEGGLGLMGSRRGGSG
jgi:hypothetical protein